MNRASPAFEDLLNGMRPADLERIALEIAADLDPAVDAEAALARLDQLADRLRPRLAKHSDPAETLRQINWALFVEEGFHGNQENYHDPGNSLFHEVLERRTGIPITLSLVYRGVAMRVGLGLEGVNLPLHFVLRTMPPAPERFIDPFHGGRLLDRAGCLALVAARGGEPPPDDDETFAPCTDRQFVARLIANLIGVYQMLGEVAPLEPLYERMVRLEPASARLHEQYALILSALARPGAALNTLDQFLARVPSAWSESSLRALRHRLRLGIAESN
jgi:regulator of sirC expression with transglutaminase-like and TPR domain